jgi:hypothetical protein
MNTIEINGKEYTLAYNIGSMKKFQKRTGLNPFDGTVFDKIDPIIFSELLFSMVQGKIDMKEIDSISGKDMSKLQDALEKVMQESESEKK